MSRLVIRQLLIDLERPLPRHWAGGNAFLTAYMNTLSFSFPSGEQFFIDAVRDALPSVHMPGKADVEHLAKAFVGQEASHRRIHERFNAHLLHQGLDNGWGRRSAHRIARIRRLGPEHQLAATAAFEHFTAIMSEYLLANEALLDGTEERLRKLWLWHACEEIEHKSVAFDLYRAAGGRYPRRIAWFLVATAVFVYESFRQTADNLRRDGSLFRLATVADALRYILGWRGLFWRCFIPWLSYLNPRFHPSRFESGRALRWLNENQAAFRTVHRPESSPASAPCR